MKHLYSKFKIQGSVIFSGFLFFSVTSLFAQVDIDNAIQLSGSDGTRKVTNLELPMNGTDAANKDYVDAAVDGLSGGSFTFSVAAETPTLGFMEMPGFSVRHRIDLRRLTGAPGVVTLTASGFPSGIAWDFFSGGGYVSYSSDLEMVRVSAVTPGVYTITVTGTGGGSAVSTTFDLNVQAVKRVFMTSTKYNGNLGGLAGADIKCQARADAASLGGTWMAWLSSTTVSASSRLSHHTGPYVLVDGTMIATDWADLTDGALLTNIKLTELNTATAPGSYSSYPTVWSNTNINGSSNTQDCSAWTNGTNTSTYIGLGIPNITDEWTRWTDITCDHTISLYCFEQ